MSLDLIVNMRLLLIVQVCALLLNQLCMLPGREIVYTLVAISTFQLLLPFHH